MLHAHRVSPSWHRHCRFHLFAIRTSSSAASSVRKSAGLSPNVASRLNLQKRIFLLHIKKYSPGVLDLLHAHRVSPSWHRHCRFHLFAIRTSSSAASSVRKSAGLSSNVGSRPTFKVLVKTKAGTRPAFVLAIKKYSPHCTMLELFIEELYNKITDINTTCIFNQIANLKHLA